MDTYGPPVPPSFASNHQNKDEEEDFAIGPTPPGTSAPHRHYEKPSFSKDTEDSNKREEWMLSLPDMKKKTQLSHLQGSLPTNFRKNAVAPQDDSWTKNPNEPDSHSPKKKKKRSRSRDDFDDAYDREQEKAAKSSKKDRDRDKKSLLELHKAKLKKEKKVRFLKLHFRLVLIVQNFNPYRN